MSKDSGELLGVAEGRRWGSAWPRYGVAVASVLAATAIREALSPVLGPNAPYLPFTLAVMIAARFGGRGPGFLATGLSTLGVPLLFLPSFRVLDAGLPAAATGLALFVIVGLLISQMVGSLREAHLSVARAEEGLRSQAQLIELSHDAIIMMDADRRISAWNAGAEEIYGWPRTSAIGMPIHEFLQTTSRLTNVEIDEILWREGRWEGELNHVARDGRHLRVESRQILVRGEKHPTLILEINRDITQRVESDEALRESESFYRQTLESIPGMVFTTRPDGYCDYQSQQWVDYTGVPINEHLGSGWNRLLHPNDQRRAMAAWRAAVAGQADYNLEYRVRRHDGAYEWFKVIGQPIRDASGEVVRWFGVALNIEELKKAEKAMRDALEQRRLALKAAKLGAWEFRLENGELSCDEQGREILGLTGDGGLSYVDFLARIHTDDRAGADNAFRQAIAGANGGECSREFRVVRTDGEVRWLATHGRVFFQEDGVRRRALRFVGILLDVTERRLAEERLRETHKLESIRVLAGGVAHDFNNLITIIMGRAHLALEQSEQSEHCRSIISASERAADLTRQLLAYAGKGQAALEIIEVSHLVERLKDLLSTSVPKRVNLSYSLAEGLPCIEADPSRIEQILMNLVINAGEAIPPKTDGRIEIGTSRCEVSEEMARFQSRTREVEQGLYVCLEVRDNGTGMDESTISRIFEPFFSTKFTGRGLGLAAVDGLVRASKGFVEVRSSPGIGTAFSIYLPACEKPHTSTPGAVPAAARVSASFTVLVVDDEEMIRSMVSAMLKCQGYEAMEAKDGKDALRVLGDASCLPSVVLLDLAMPVMGGDELVPILAEQYPSLKIIVCSGFPEEEVRRGFPPDRVAAFLKKPYTMAALAEKLLEVTGRAAVS